MSLVGRELASASTSDHTRCHRNAGDPWPTNRLLWRPPSM